MTHKELWVTSSFFQQTSSGHCLGSGPALDTLRLEQSLTPTYLSHNPMGTQHNGDISPGQAEPAMEAKATQHSQRHGVEGRGQAGGAAATG